MNALLYYYSDLHGCAGWFPTCRAFRAAFPYARMVIRPAHQGIPAPDGYRKTGRELGGEPVERIKTMRDFIHAL
jgi:hypothetical protein